MTDETNVQPELNLAEAEAAQFGWVPEGEYKGNPEDWKDAETFLKRGKEINGFLRKDLEKIKHKNQTLESELSEIRETMEEFRKYHNETEARAYKRALDDLKKQKVEAIEQGDGARVIEIDDTIESIKEAQAKPTPKAEKKTDTSYDKDYFEWAKVNTWYVTNPEAKAIAELYGAEINAKFPEKKGKEFLEEVTNLVKESHPEFFTNPARNVGMVGSSSDGRSPSGNNKKKGYNDLPAEAKAACDKFVKQKLMTADQYVAEYQWN
jgi:hypothetical protein